MQRKYNQMEMCHFDRCKRENEIHLIRQECLESYKSECCRLNDDEHVKSSKRSLPHCLPFPQNNRVHSMSKAILCTETKIKRMRFC